jgi:hypothetical protein
MLDDVPVPKKMSSTAVESLGAAGGICAADGINQFYNTNRVSWKESLDEEQPVWK